MKLKIFILVLLISSLWASSTYACTSFALYGNQIFYGMNFDYFSIPLKFFIESGKGMNIFHLGFLFEQTIDDPKYKGYFAKTCGMNTKGLFCASQEVEPFVEGSKTPRENEIHIDDLYEAISNCSDIEEIKASLPDKQWIQFIGPSIHHMFADSKGKAMVTETDNTCNYITEIEGDFMVMANFANHSLRDTSPESPQGAGAQRYGITHRVLSENAQDFSIEKGFSLLKSAQCKDKGFKTLCSMICHPGTHSVYIALNLDMERIWKVRIDQKTIETHKGYSRYQKMLLNENGMGSEELEHLGG